MNEADRIAYEEWLSSHCGPKLRVRFMPAWQAACKHKQSEIDRLKDRVSALESTSVVRSLEVQRNALKARVGRLKDVVSKLSTAVENIDGDLQAIDGYASAMYCADIADQVLQESEQQSLAEVKAEALRVAANKLEAGISSSIRLTTREASVLRTYADRILQEAKDSSSDDPRGYKALAARERAAGRQVARLWRETNKRESEDLSDV